MLRNLRKSLEQRRKKSVLFEHSKAKEDIEVIDRELKDLKSKVSSDKKRLKKSKKEEKKDFLKRKK
jgi:hypothetical protein